MTIMDERKSQSLSVLSIVGLFGLAYWLDIIMVSWRTAARAEFNMQPFLVFSYVLLIVMAIFTVFLSWLLLVHFRPTWVTVILCLLIGLNFVVFVVSVVSGNPILNQFVQSTGFALLNRGVFEFGNGSMTLQTEALLLVIGVINLIRIVRVATPKSV